MLRDLRELRLTPAVLVRMGADVAMMAMSLLTAFVLRFLLLVQVQQSAVDPATVFERYVSAYWQNLLAIVAISLPLFAFSGFYSRGRFYQSRYKVLVVAQAVTVAYLLLAFLAYVASGIIYIPRGVWIAAWLITLVTLTTARAWTAIWRRISRSEPSGSKPEVASARKEDHRRVLVIGGAGFVGSALVPLLLDAGYRVRVLDALLFGKEPLEECLDHPDLEIVNADFRHVHKVVEAMAGVDVVIHLGGIVGDPACALDEDITTEINLVATQVIAEIAKGNGIQRFIFASTCSVYGASDAILDERSALRPVSLYARSKIASERVLRALTDQSFRPTVLRFGTIYGLSGRSRFDLVVNLLTAKAVTEGKITVYGGEQWRPFLHVQDAARSVFQVLQRPLSVVGGEVFNVGSNEQNYRISDVADLIHSSVPESQIVNMGSDEDARNYRVDFSKIRRLVKFTPEWTLEGGIHQVIETVKNGEIGDYRDVKHSNVQFLREETQSQIVRREFDWARLLLDES